MKSSPYSVTPRPAGDYAVQRFDRAAKQIVRWGIYATREQAEEVCRFANRSRDRK